MRKPVAASLPGRPIILRHLRDQLCEPFCVAALGKTVSSDNAQVNVANGCITQTGSSRHFLAQAVILLS